MDREEHLMQPIHQPHPKDVTRLGNVFKHHLFEINVLHNDAIEVCADDAGQAAALARLWGYTTLGLAIKIN